MAQMRTKAERQRILKKCLEIENEGGNGTEKKGGVSNERDHEEERADRVPGDPAGEMEDVQQEI